MNLAEMLSYADIHQLIRIAGHYSCECDGHSKNELIQSILSAINRKGVFDRFVQDLSQEDIRFMNSLLFDRRDSFSLEELIARVQQTTFAKEDKEKLNPRETISKFKQRGWLFNGYSHKTKYLFQIPQDIKNKFAEALFRQFHTGLITTEEPAVYRDEHKLILDDIYFFLQFAYHHPLLLTSDGSMYKRFLQQIMEGLAVQEEPAGKGGWRFGYGRRFRDYPNRFSLIYDYCYYNGLIEEKEHMLALTEKGTEAVLAGRKDELSLVYRTWMRIYKGPVPNLQSIVHWIERLSRQRWVTGNSLAGILCPFVKPYFYDSPDNIFDQRILQMLMHMGIIRLGEDENQGKVVLTTLMGSRLILGTYVAEEDKIEIPIDNA